MQQMVSFRSLVSRLSLNHPVSRPEFDLRLADAYQRVFLGNATEDDRTIVLTDLGDFSGFYRITPPDDGGRDAIVFNEGMRAVYGRIFRYLRVSAEERASLESAVRETAAHRMELARNQEEG